METPGLAACLATLGEDLLLLSIRPRDGKIMTAGRIGYGLMASELVRLAAAGRIDVVSDRIVVRNPAATGDTELDAALLSLAGAGNPPRPETWIGLPRRGIRNAYADRLISAGVLRMEPSKLLGMPRYRIMAPERVARAKSALDAIAQSAGQRVDVVQAAFGGLACAIDLDNVLYPGRDGRLPRARLTQIATGGWTTRAARAAGGRSAGAGSAGGAGPAAREAAADAALAADAAVDVAADAVAQAAVQAATSAAINGAHSVGGHGTADHGTAHHGTAHHGADGGHAGGGAGGHH